jgi:hypothetical protein
MTTPLIPVSWGELLDKIVILEIKCQRLRNTAAQANASAELVALRQAADGATGVPELMTALRAVNTRLWQIEDLIREKDAANDFGAHFVALARSVYHENDERGRIKQALNQRLGSALVEEKQYSAY